MPFPETPDHRLDFARFYQLTPEQRRAIISENNGSIHKVKRALRFTNELSGQAQYKVAAAWHAVFRHNEEQVYPDHYNALREKERARLDQNMSADERDRLHNALRL